MISRVADNCFWLGRYLERAESASRVLRVTHALALDGDLPPAQVWSPVITVGGEDASFDLRFPPERRGDGELVQQYLTWEGENPVSIACSVSAMRENARSIREVVSLEVWESINELHLWLQQGPGRSEYARNRDAFYRHVRQSAQLVLGEIRNTMLHDNAFDFISLGVFLERVGQTARILDVHHHALMQLSANLVREESLWLSLLRACSGFEPFMKRCAGRVTPRAVAAFLILEENFPRSIRFCLHQANLRLGAIRSPDDPVLPKLESHARLRALEEVVSAQHLGLEGTTHLHELLTRVVEETAAVCNEMSQELLAAPRPPAGLEGAPAKQKTRSDAADAEPGAAREA